MNRILPMRRIAAACLSSFVLLAGVASAQSTFIGSLADWAANPTQTSGDKQFTYLTQSGSWSNAELFTISSNIPLDSHSLSIDALSAYIGPYTLSVGYELLITSTDNYFQSMSLDVNASGTATLITKDIFATFDAFSTGTAPGSGTWSLTLINSSSGSTVSLPPIQTIWVRDTITADATGSILGISNTVVQLPEPGMLAPAAIGMGLGVWGCRRRRRAATTAARFATGRRNTGGKLG
jgi:hypothetical protein